VTFSKPLKKQGNIITEKEIPKG